MNLTKEELDMLDNTKSAKEWDDNCDKIKEARNGQYPEDWWPVMMMSGRAEKILNSFGSDTKIRITGL